MADKVINSEYLVKIPKMLKFSLCRKTKLKFLQQGYFFIFIKWLK